MRLRNSRKECEDATEQFIKPASGPRDALKEPKGRGGSVCGKVAEITISDKVGPLKTCCTDAFREQCGMN